LYEPPYWSIKDEVFVCPIPRPEDEIGLAHIPMTMRTQLEKGFTQYEGLEAHKLGEAGEYSTTDNLLKSMFA